MVELTVVPIIHVGRKRVARDLPLCIQGGRRFELGSKVQIRRRVYEVLGLGYEHGQAVLHLRLEGVAW